MRVRGAGSPSLRSVRRSFVPHSLRPERSAGSRLLPPAGSDRRVRRMPSGMTQERK